jgi:hypothetical protein
MMSPCYQDLIATAGLLALGGVAPREIAMRIALQIEAVTMDTQQINSYTTGVSPCVCMSAGTHLHVVFLVLVHVHSCGEAGWSPHLLQFAAVLCVVGSMLGCMSWVSATPALFLFLLFCRAPLVPQAREAITLSCATKQQARHEEASVQLAHSIAMRCSLGAMIIKRHGLSDLWCIVCVYRSEI